MFSFGVILWELITWQMPWEEMGVFQVHLQHPPHTQRTTCTTSPASVTVSHHLTWTPDAFLPQGVLSVPVDDSALQIMVSVAEKNQRPDIPQEAEKLPGGTFEGWDTYVGLIQRCWGPQPAERPSFEAIINDLRGLLTESASQTRQRRLTDPLSAAAGAPGGELPHRSGATAAFQCPNPPPCTLLAGVEMHWVRALC